MGKIKCEIKKDSSLVKFEAVENGELFVFKGKAYIKIFPLEVPTYEVINAFEVESGNCTFIYSDTLVTYVKNAELKLTI